MEYSTTLNPHCLKDRSVTTVSVGHETATFKPVHRRAAALHSAHDHQYRGRLLALALDRLDAATEHQRCQVDELEQRDQRDCRRRHDQDAHRQSPRGQPILSAEDALDYSRQLLQGTPVVEAFLFGEEHRWARVAVFVEVFGETALGAGETDEVIDFVRLRFDEEIRFLGGIALEAEALGDLVAFLRTG